MFILIIPLFSSVSRLKLRKITTPLMYLTSVYIDYPPLPVLNSSVHEAKILRSVKTDQAGHTSDRSRAR